MISLRAALSHLACCTRRRTSELPVGIECDLATDVPAAALKVLGCQVRACEPVSYRPQPLMSPSGKPEGLLAAVLMRRHAFEAR